MLNWRGDESWRTSEQERNELATLPLSIDHFAALKCVQDTPTLTLEAFVVSHRRTLGRYRIEHSNPGGGRYAPRTSRWLLAEGG